MEDPGWSWPFWKFGLKKDDLFSKLHDQYNTFPSSIQDPEAFHHDVYEISTEASSSDEFYRLMAERKSQRLHELNDLLESASLEIIANPALIGTTQWQHALQLFRTKSLDSLVRYFASYLPDNHPWHHGSGSDSSSSSSDGESLAASHASSFFGDIEDEHCLTQEPLSINTCMPTHLPPSPRSMTMQSDSSEVSPIDCGHHDYIINTLTPARTLSFSDSDHEEHFGQLKSSVPALHDDDEETSQSDDAETPGTSVSDLSEIHTSQHKELLITEDFDDTIQDEYISITHTHDTHTQLFTDTMDSETPTPKPEAPSAPATSFFETKLSSLRRRSLSPSRIHPHHITLSHHDCRKPQRSQRRRECSPDGGRRRRNAVEQGGGRIQKPVADGPRSRLRERRQAMQ